MKRDGSDLCEAGKTISLDMTCFFWEEKWYVIWSQRQFVPKDLGAWLYIAELNPDEPWKLATDPVILSKPDYGWGNNHTFVEEGPYALVSNGTLYITFSAAAVDTSYVVSYLTIEAGKDLLKPENWRKNNYPILLRGVWRENMERDIMPMSPMKTESYGIPTMQDPAQTVCAVAVFAAYILIRTAHLCLTLPKNWT